MLFLGLRCGVIAGVVVVVVVKPCTGLLRWWGAGASGVVLDEGCWKGVLSSLEVSPQKCENSEHSEVSSSWKR